MPAVKFVHESGSSDEAIWSVVSRFQEIDWLVGEGNYQVSDHNGFPARVLTTGAGDVIEYLLKVDSDNRLVRYGVEKNRFVPVDNYVAVVSVTPRENGCVVDISSTFELDKVPLADVEIMLKGAYQMIANQLDAATRGD